MGINTVIVPADVPKPNLEKHGFSKTVVWNIESETVTRT